MTPVPRRRPYAAIALLVSACLAIGIVVGNLALPTRPSHPAPALRVVTAGAAAPASGSSTTTTTSAAGTTTTTTTPTNPTVAAPPGYANQLVSLYGDIYTAATQVQVPGNSQQVTPPGTFEQQVSGLSSADLNQLYTATSNIPNFNSLAATFQQASAVEARAAKILKLGAGRAGGSGSGAGHLGAGAPRPNSGLGVGATLVVPQALTNYTPTSPVIIYPAASCPNGAPGINYGETAIFALQVAVDVISEVVAVIPDGLSAAFGNITIPNIARIIVAVIQLGVAITHDTFAYLQAVSNDCAANYLAALAGNTDNSAFQTFQELTQVAGTANEIDTNLANLTNQTTNQFDQQLTLAIEQALSSPAGSVPMAQMELPASLGGYLNSTPVSENEVVTNTIAAMQASGQPLNAMAKRDEALGEEALSAGAYKLSFDYFRLAYAAAAN